MQQQEDQKKQVCLPDRQAYNFALKLIGVHPRTVLEIENKLKNKDFLPKVIDQTVALLKDQDYLNDEDYAKAWLEERIKNRPSGRALCWKKLKEKGIDKDIIDKVLDVILDENKELELAETLAQNKKAALKTQHVHYKKISHKIAFFLQNRGFPANVIMEVLEHL